MDVGVEQLVPVPDTLDSSAVVDTNGNNSDNTTTAGSDNSQDHDNMEDNINEAASEDSGMSSVDNHNMSGEEYIEPNWIQCACQPQVDKFLCLPSVTTRASNEGPHEGS